MPKKPWLNKTKKKPPPEPENEPSVENEDIVPVPTKGYNLDFLDQLDDPNFNPFETKTSVAEKFDDSEPQPEALKEESTSLNNNQNKVNIEENKNEEKIEKPQDEKKPKKALPPRPWLKEGPKKRLPEERGKYTG